MNLFSRLVDAYEKASEGHMTEWEQEREKEEFEKAAKFYKPMTNMMASRFTRAKYHDDDTVEMPAKEEVTLLKNGEHKFLVFLCQKVILKISQMEFKKVINFNTN
jgi:hypothetical protein